MQSLSERYAQLRLLNLLSTTTPAEVQLSTEYEAQVQHLGVVPSIKYSTYDVNAVTKGNNFHVLQSYGRERSRELDDFQLFLREHGSETPIAYQQGIFRVNCIDCLDRTNLMQSVLVKQALTPITLRYGVDITYLWEAFLQKVWADNGDTLSKLYTGTGALKSEVTRGGVRSALGMLSDAKKSGTSSLWEAGIRFTAKLTTDVFSQSLLCQHVSRQGASRHHRFVARQIC